MKKTAEYIRNFLFLLLLFTACYGCNNKELVIDTIDNRLSPDGHVFNLGNSGLYGLQYYTIANYKHYTYDSLYLKLNSYIDSLYSYDKIIETMKGNGSFRVFFYKDGLFINKKNYKKNIYWARESESGRIDKYNFNLIAWIDVYSRKEEDEQYYIFVTRIYNSGLLFEKRDTIKHSFNSEEKDINEKFYISEFNRSENGEIYDSKYLVRYILGLIIVISIGLVVFWLCKRCLKKETINNFFKPNNFFRFNILIDVVALLLFRIFIFLYYYDTYEDFFSSCIEKSYIFFLLHFVFVFIHIFRNKKIKIWKIILYSIVLLSISWFVFFIGDYHTWFFSYY